MLPVGSQRIHSEADGGVLIATTTAHTKGSYTDLITSTPFDAQALEIMFGTATVVARKFLIDIAIGEPGSEQIIVENMMFSLGDTGTNATRVVLPVFIPEGSRIRARAQTNNATSSPQVSAKAYLHALHPLGVPGLIGKISTYGAATGTTSGTVIDPGGTIDTKGSWVELVSATARNHKWLAVLISGRANQVPQAAGFRYDLAIGAAASEQIILPDIRFNSNSVSDIFDPSVFDCYFPIPAGSRLSMRGLSSTNDATDRLFEAIVLAG